VALIQLTSSSFGKPTWKNLLRTNPAAVVSVGFFLLYSLSETAATKLSFLFLAGGFIFPGMTHGSLDFQIMNRFMGKRWSKAATLSLYLFLVAALLVAWWLAPTAVFLLFLFNSAYHFGETDLRSLSAAKIIMKPIYGGLLLSFLFISHYRETTDYMQSFGLTLPAADEGILLASSGVLLALLASVLAFNGRKSTVWDTVLALGIGMTLPLVLAFGIYYILVHSRTAWKDLGTELQLEDPVMLRKAAPFTIAGCLFMAGTYWLMGNNVALPDQPVVLIVAGLAAITLPHTIAMALLYRSAGSRPTEVND
jgi:Brp/Blh family beta-carotene 15,15'-monooxygenase